MKWLGRRGGWVARPPTFRWVWSYAYVIPSPVVHRSCCQMERLLSRQWQSGCRWPKTKFSPAWIGRRCGSVSSTNPIRMTQWAEVYFNLVLCFLNADKQIRLVQKPTIVQDRYLGHVLGIKAGFHPIFACLNLIRRIHFQLINRSTPCRRCTQQLEPSSVEIKMLVPRVLARVE
jgi:hypothetical protein